MNILPLLAEYSTRYVFKSVLRNVNDYIILTLILILSLVFGPVYKFPGAGRTVFCSREKRVPFSEITAAWKPLKTFEDAQFEAKYQSGRLDEDFCKKLYAKVYGEDL